MIYRVNAKGRIVVGLFLFSLTWIPVMAYKIIKLVWKEYRRNIETEIRVMSSIVFRGEADRELVEWMRTPTTRNNGNKQ